MFTAVLVIHVSLAVILVFCILIQHGKGADAGVAFGSATSASAFGSKGASSFLSRLTTGLAIGFFCTSLLLAYLVSSQTQQSNLSNSVISQSNLSTTHDSPAMPATDLPTNDVPNSQ